MSNTDLLILGMGNPLLDISADVEPSYMEKYGVKPGNAILAEDKHMPMYEELMKDFKPNFTAGGATQNSIRVAQWMLQKKNATAFIGCVGKDQYADTMRKAATEDNVVVHYMEDEKTPTGTCACLIHEKERSLIANLSAANNYKKDHLDSEVITSVYQAAKLYYIAGFFLTVSPDSIKAVAQYSADHDRTFCMNLSAPFIIDFFSEPLLATLPLVDIIFGNETEAETFGKKANLEDTSVTAVAKHLATMPKTNEKKPRIAVITQGASSTIVAQGDQVTEYAVEKIDSSKIVDTNGAGDAFVGGFLSQYVQGKSIEECVKAGHYAAGVVICVSGIVLPEKPDFQ